MLNKILFLTLSLFLLAPALSRAAYPDQGTILRHEQDQNGAARLIVRFLGNAGEPIVDRAWPVAAYPTPAAALQALRNWISVTVTELNLARTAATAPQVAPNTVITGLAPSATPQTAKSVWRAKVQIHSQTCTQSFTGAVATACAALKTDIEGSYQAGFLDAN